MITKELQNMKPMSGKERLGAWRDSEYMGAEDIEQGTEPVLTIKALYNGMITLARGKERHDVIAFVEESVPGSINQVRPLVVNSTNRKTLRKLYKSTSADALVGKKIQLFLQPGVRDPSTGDKVDGIRIRDVIPKGAKYSAPKCEACGKEITGLTGFAPEQIAETNRKRYGMALCVACGQKRKAEIEAEKARAEEARETSVGAAEKAGAAPAPLPAGTMDGGTHGTEKAQDRAVQDTGSGQGGASAAKSNPAPSVDDVLARLKG